MLVETVRRSWHGHESVEDQVFVDIGRVVQVSEPDLMARGVAVDLLQMAKRIGPQCEAAEYEDLSREEISPWTASLPMIEGAIKPYGDDTVELSMKAPMSVSKPADLGYGSRRMVTGSNGHDVLPRFWPSRWR